MAPKLVSKPIKTVLMKEGRFFLLIRRGDFLWKSEKFELKNKFIIKLLTEWDKVGYKEYVVGNCG